MSVKNSHHLWEPRVEGDRVSIRRTKAEELEDEAREVTAALWGLWGASLVDDPTLASEIPKSIVARFNHVARDVSKPAQPKLPSWDELRRAYTVEAVDQVRQSIALGIKIRQASKELNVPFLMASEIVAEFPSVDKRVVKALVNELKTGKITKVARCGTVGRKLASLYNDFAKHPRKIAIDEAAKAYYKNYWGPFGEDMVADIKKRVRADLAEKWLRKNGVDDVAAKYWREYFSSGYGEALVSVVPKSLSPAKKDK